MSHYFDNREFYNKPILLTSLEEEKPILAISDLFADLNLSELRELLSQVRETCLTVEHGPFRDADNRSKLLTDFSKIEKALEAAYLLYLGQKYLEEYSNHD